MNDAEKYIIVAVLILIIVFLVLRGINCWYWKINERVELQRETNELLEKILNKMEDMKRKTAI